MSSDDQPPSGSNVPAQEHEIVSLEIEQALEQVGTRYLADLRMLSEKFGQFYGPLLDKRDAQIAELGRQLEIAEHERDEQSALLEAQNEQIAELSRRLEEAERELADQAARLAAKDERIAALSQSIAVAEQRQNELEAQIQAFRHIGARHLADLQALSAQFNQPAQIAAGKDDPPAPARETIRTTNTETKRPKRDTRPIASHFVKAHYHFAKVARFRANGARAENAAGGEGPAPTA
jgi:chromosome segregation ATPase